MTEPTPEKILDRVRKLLALASSSNVHEAAAAAAQAQQLLTKHGLEAARLDQDDFLTDEHPVRGKRFTPWRNTLVVVVAECNDCNVLLRKLPADNGFALSYLLSGRPEKVAAVRYLFKYLQNKIDELTEAYRTELLDYGYTASVRRMNSFRLGAVVRIRERMFEARRQTLAGLVADDDQAKLDAEKAALAEFMKRRGKPGRARNRKLAVDSTSFRTGIDAADSIALGGRGLGRGALANLQEDNS